MYENERILTSLYCFAYSLYIIGALLGQTLLPVPSELRYTCIFLGIGLLLLKILIGLGSNPIVAKTTIFQGLLLTAMITLAVVSVRYNKEYGLLFTIIFISGAKGVDLQKILKTFIITASVLLVILLVAYLCGIVGDSQIQRATSAGKSRRTFGYRSATDLVELIFYILCADLVIWSKSKRPIWWRVIIYLSLGVFGIVFTDSRLPSFSIFVLVPLIIVLKYTNINVNNNKLTRFFVKYTFEICLVLSIVIQNLFMLHKYGWLEKFDSISSARLSNNAIGVVLFGYTLWGQNIYDSISQYMQSWFFIDSSYYSFLIEYGIVLLICVAIMYSVTQSKVLKENSALAIILAISCIESLSCREYFLIEYNVFLVAFMALVEREDNTLNNQEKEIEYYGIWR